MRGTNYEQGVFFSMSSNGVSYRDINIFGKMT